MHKTAHPKGSLDDLFRKIDDAVGPPESESETEREHRHEVMAADHERREQRRAS